RRPAGGGIKLLDTGEPFLQRQGAAAIGQDGVTAPCHRGAEAQLPAIELAHRDGRPGAGRQTFDLIHELARHRWPRCPGTRMRFLDLTLATPADNLALDESLLLHAEQGHAGEVLRIWEWPARAVVLGSAGRLAED